MGQDTQQSIIEQCDIIKKILLEKNRKYGNSAFNTGAVFEVEPLTAIRARINDKVSRIKAAEGDDQEDAILDLIGYLILYRIQNNITKWENT